jgi:hypothetical protein
MSRERGEEREAMGQRGGPQASRQRGGVKPTRCLAQPCLSPPMMAGGMRGDTSAMALITGQHAAHTPSHFVAAHSHSVDKAACNLHTASFLPHIPETKQGSVGPVGLCCLSPFIR